MKRFKIIALLVAVVFVSMTATAMAGTLQDVRQRGYLKVGVNGGVFGFSMPDKKGVWKGLDVDTGRAVAAAVQSAPPVPRSAA